MSFVQSAFLFAAAAAAVPVLLHWLGRWQIREVSLGTMRFLQEIVRDGSRRRRIQRWLLLATRMALLGLLALLFARPLLLATGSRDGNRLRVILIDCSASMGMPGQRGRLVEDAIAAADEATGTLGSDAKIERAWFDQGVEPVPAEQRLRLDAPPGGDTDYLTALRWARDRIASSPGSLADVVLITDLQQSGLVGEEGDLEELGFPSEVPVQIVDVGRPAANNVSVVAVNAGANRQPSDRPAAVGATLFNYGSLPAEQVPVVLTASDGSRSVRVKKSIDVPAGQAEELQFDLGVLEAGRWQITVTADANDDLAADNTRLTAVDIRRPTPVLIFERGDGGGGPETAGYYLRTALEPDRFLADAEPRPSEEGEISAAAPPPGRYITEVHPLDEGPLPPLDVATYPLVLIISAAELDAGQVQQLAGYVRGGGRLMVFAGDRAIPEAAADAWTASGLAPGTLSPPRSESIMPLHIVSIRSTDPLLQPFEDPQQGDLRRLAFRRVQPIEPHRGVEVLASFSGGLPALVRHRLGSGQSLWFLAPAGPQAGSWTASGLYLPLIQQMAADLLGLSGEGPIRPRSLGGGDVPTQIQQSGFYPIGQATYVVNLPPKESDPTRIEAREFRERLNLSSPEPKDAPERPAVASQTRHELWPWFASIAMVLAVFEFSLANRTRTQ